MSRTSRIAMLTAALMFTAGSAASANTVELTLTVPIKLTLPTSTTSPAWAAGGARQLKPFDIDCVVGSGLGYATGSGAQGQIMGQGSSNTNGGSQNIIGPDGKTTANPSATVVITYDDGASASSAPGTAKTPGAYLCWVQWKTAIPQLAPIFVQGALQAK